MPERPLSPEHLLLDSPLDGFVVHVGHEGSRTVASVQGDVDIATAPSLRILLRALVDNGCNDLVVDLAEVTFMGAEGLGVLAFVAGRLRDVDGALTLRSPPRQTLRILDLTGLRRHLHVDEQSTAALGADLVRATSFPQRDLLVDAELQNIVAVASASVVGADGVSVTVERVGRMATVAASNDTVLRMDGHQYATGEGPCLSAAAAGEEFHSASLALESRWPAFVPRARAEGIASILSTPLLVEDHCVGALNIYSNTEGAFGVQQQELALVLAGQAALIVAGRGDDANEIVAGRIASALLSREILAQAQGVLMDRHGMSSGAATAALHRAARTAESSVLDYAATVVLSTSHTADAVDRRGHA